MKFREGFNKLFHNKLFLYFIVFLSFIHLFGYMMLGSINSIVLFILIGLIMTSFSRNMALILIVPLILVNFLTMGSAIKEGLENKIPSPVETKKTVDDPKMPVDNDISKAMDDLKANDKKEQEQKQKEQKNILDEPKPLETKEKMTGAMKDRRIDYGTTIEDAYDNLKGILGGEGLEKLSTDTQKLMQQQMKLAETMKNMGPLLEGAKSMLKTIDFDNLGGIGDKLKKMM